MMRGTSGTSSSLSERLRSFSSRYNNDSPDGDAANGTSGFTPDRNREDFRSSLTEVRGLSSSRKYDRDSQERESTKETSPSPEGGFTSGSRFRREGSYGRGLDSDSTRGSYYGSNSSLSSTSSASRHFVPLLERGGGGSSSNGHHGAGVGTSGGITAESISSRLSSKREAREAFFTKQQQNNDQMSAPKFDPSMLRERERDKESLKEKLAYNSTSGGGHHGPSGGPSGGSKEVEGYVGFANLPNQVYRKSVKRGFEFTLMVVGESGLGKSTLINSMFLADLYSAEYPGPSHRIKKTVNVEPTQVLLKEGGVQLRLTVVDTPGFGDAVDNSNCWHPVTEYIENKYDEYLNAESRVNRKTMPDNRVHCCLYFISPNGHGLKPLDVEFMKRLHDKVNIIPLIAKADTLTPDECREFKKTILNEIAQHKIKIYEFPDADDEEENKLQKKLKDRVPFAVVGANTVVESQGRKLRGRMYPWGIVEVENLEHNDFIALRNMLIRTYLQDLKDVTNNVHYENFRYNKLASVSGSGKNKNTSGKSPTSPSKGPVPAVRRRKLEKAVSRGHVSASRGAAPSGGSLGDLRVTIPPTTRSPLSPQLSPHSPSSPQSPLSVHSTSPVSSNGHAEISNHTFPRRPPRSKYRRTTSNLNNLSIDNNSPPKRDLFPLKMDINKMQDASLQSPINRNMNPLIMMEDERREHVAKMKKMEAEMEQVFEMKVKEKKHKLKESELDLQRRAEQMKKSLEQQQKELEEKRRAFEKERAQWEEQQRQLEEQRRRSLENAKDNQKKDKKKSLF